VSQKRSVGFELRALNNLLRRDFEKRKPKELDCTSGVHGWAIGYLYDNREKEVFQRDFERHFQIRRSTATKMLQLMEKNGFIMRQEVESDARLKKIVLTDKAIEVHKKVIGVIKERDEMLQKGISEEELEVFYTVCEKIKANLEENND